jgi:enterochelin esterase-like enzyme
VEASGDRGRIEVIRDLASGVPGLKSRDVYVYLPPGYDEGDKRYPVLYLQDGQNCWDDPVEPFGHGGWGVNLQGDELIRAGRVAPFIAVGVGNTVDRMAEYGPGPDVISAARHPYLRFLVGTLKPLIDQRYRTRPDAKSTGIMGASMGGLIALQATLLHPDVFGQAGCVSPSFVVFDAEPAPYARLVRQVGKVPVRLYFHNGTGGSRADGAGATRRMVALVRETGWRDGEDLVHHEMEGAHHNERSWRAQLAIALRFFFGT